MTPFSSALNGRIPTLLLAVFVVFAASFPAHAQRAFALRYTTTTSGSIDGIGNVNMNCAAFAQPGSATCASSRTNTDGSGNQRNNDFTMVNSDVDNDASTFNSSSATLNMPAGSTVLFAGLYWSGRGGNATQRGSVRFATPASGYGAITAAVVDVASDGYQGFANVTSQVVAAGNGTYTVADIFGNSSTDSWAGWSLVVAYSNLSLPTRNLSIFDGWQRAADVGNPINLTISGFVTPPTGPVTSTIGVLAWDGDRPGNDGGAGLQFGPTLGSLSPVGTGTGGINPDNNFWNSTISFNGSHVTAGRTPAYTNTLGMDLDFQTPNTPLPNGVTSAVVQVRGTSNEVVWPGMVSLATDVYAPDLVSSVAKTVIDENGGKAEPGDVLTYTIEFNNSGQDGATNVVLNDPIPAGTTYVPGSLSVLTNDTDDGGGTNGGDTGVMTDAADGDIAEFAGGSVVFRLGRNDSTWDGGTGVSNGGMISAGHAGSFRFQVTLDADVSPTTTVTNVVNVTHNAQTIPDFDAQGQASAAITVTDEVDLSIVKTVNPTTAVIGDTVTYVLEASNAGTVQVVNSILRDPAVAGLDCSAATPTCSATGDAQCPASSTIAELQGAGLTIALLPVGDTVRIEFACVVTATP
ncbi:MAG: DUF11 domain-containing protein [Pseudoxanthomonas sp.]